MGRASIPLLEFHLLEVRELISDELNSNKTLTHIR